MRKIIIIEKKSFEPIINLIKKLNKLIELKI